MGESQGVVSDMSSLTDSNDSDASVQALQNLVSHQRNHIKEHLQVNRLTIKLAKAKVEQQQVFDAIRNHMYKAEYEKHLLIGEGSTSHAKLTWGCGYSCLKRKASQVAARARAAASAVKEKSVKAAEKAQMLKTNAEKALKAAKEKTVKAVAKTKALEHNVKVAAKEAVVKTAAAAKKLALEKA